MASDLERDRAKGSENLYALMVSDVWLWFVVQNVNLVRGHGARAGDH